MMSPVKELLEIHRGRLGNYKIRLTCGEAAKYITTFEGLLSNLVDASIKDQERILFLEKMAHDMDKELRGHREKYATLEAQKRLTDERYDLLMQRTR